MLTLKDILAVGRMMEQTGRRPDVALDRHDNPDHRTCYSPQTDYQQSLPKEKPITLRLDYHETPDDVRIIQK